LQTGEELRQRWLLGLREGGEEALAGGVESQDSRPSALAQGRLAQVRLRGLEQLIRRTLRRENIADRIEFKFHVRIAELPGQATAVLRTFPPPMPPLNQPNSTTASAIPATAAHAVRAHARHGAADWETQVSVGRIGSGSGSPAGAGASGAAIISSASSASRPSSASPYMVGSSTVSDRCGEAGVVRSIAREAGVCGNGGGPMRFALAASPADSGGSTRTMLPHLGHVRICPMAERSRTRSWVWQVVQAIENDSTEVFLNVACGRNRGRTGALARP